MSIYISISQNLMFNNNMQLSKSYYSRPCLQCFYNVDWASGRASSLQKSWLMSIWHRYLSGVRCKWSEYGPADASASPPISCFIQIQNGLIFWCWLTHVVLEKKPLNGVSIIQEQKTSKMKHQKCCWYCLFTLSVSTNNANKQYQWKASGKVNLVMPSIVKHILKFYHNPLFIMAPPPKWTAVWKAVVHLFHAHISKTVHFTTNPMLEVKSTRHMTVWLQELAKTSFRLKNLGWQYHKNRPRYSYCY